MKKLLANTAVVLLIALGAPSSAWAGFDEGMAAYKRGDYATALREWRPLAEQGHANALYNIGIMYAWGKGVPEDHAEAVRWYRKAAEQGHAEAQISLAYRYRTGGGFVPKDHAEAVRWYRKAAEQGHYYAQFNLGIMYDKGQGVPQDYVQAHMWFDLSAAQRNATAAKNRDTVTKRMTPAQVAEAQRLAREWMAKFEARKKK